MKKIIDNKQLLSSEPNMFATTITVILCLLCLPPMNGSCLKASVLFGKSLKHNLFLFTFEISFGTFETQFYFTYSLLCLMFAVVCSSQNYITDDVVTFIIPPAAVQPSPVDIMENIARSVFTHFKTAL